MDEHTHLHEQRVILFLIDGLRPDALQQAHTPVIDDLIAYGASTMNARTVSPSISLPCIASLFLGTPPQVHGITTNVWTAAAPGPNLFGVVNESERRAAAFYNWEELRDLARPGQLTTSFFLRDDAAPDERADTLLTDVTITVLTEAAARGQLVDFAFIYLGYTDLAGHRHGWMSDPYIRAIENADTCIGRVITALEPQRAAGTSTYASPDHRYGVVVTADHGGHDKGHGSDAGTDMTIPLVLYGHPAFAPGQELAAPVSILDIAPTIATWMGLTPPPAWTGRALTP